MSNQHVLATNLFYKPLSNISFDTAKTAFLEQQWLDYAELPFDRKWTYVKHAFCDMIPEASIKDIVSAFMDKRLSSTNSEYVLSRKKSLDYIERFYFLYQNNDPVFTLAHRAKASLLSLLRDAMTNSQLCEPGRYVRFESIIMEFRADKNWIDVFLQQQRYLIITELHEAFDGDVHTLGVMQQRAHEKNLGITPLHQLSDVYMSSDRKQSIERYFENHYEKKFTEYEKHAVKNLSEHLLFKLSDLLKEQHVDISSWDHASVSLPKGYRIELIPDLNTFHLDEADTDVLYLYLQDMQFQGEQLYAVTHLGNPIPLIESFKQIEQNTKDAQAPKADFEAIKQRLRQGKYTLDDAFQEQLVISALADRGATTHLSAINNLFSWMSNYLKLLDIAEIRAVFCETVDDSEQWVLKPKQRCLAQLEEYVEKRLVEQQYFITSSLLYDSHFDLQSTPLRLRDSVTCDMIEATSQKLRECMDCSTTFLITLNQEDVSRILLNHPFVLLRQMHDRAYLLADLPEIYQANQFFMDEVIQFFAIKIECLLQEKNRSAAENMLQLVLSAIKDHMSYLDTLPESLQQHPWIEPHLTQHIETIQRKKNTALEYLTFRPHMALSQLVNLTQHISMLEFSGVLEHREHAGLARLPFCSHPGLYAKFCQELPDVDHWTTYAAYKRQLTTNTPAAKYFLETTSWFVAYMRYQHHHTYFNSQHDVAMHLKQIKMSLHDYFNIFIGFVLPVSIIILIRIFVIEPLFGPSPNRENFSDALEICSNTVLDEKHSTHMTDFMGNCGDMLRDIPHDTEETFLTRCIKNLITEGDPRYLANAILTCTHKLQSEGGENTLGMMASSIVLTIITTSVLSYFTRNPPFPTNNLSFCDELQRFKHRLQGTRNNTPALFPAHDLLTRCSNLIIRLRGLDDLAAHQKADVLAQLLNEVKKTLPDTTTDAEIAQHLLTKRDVVQQEKVHHVSFFSVAAQRRCSDTFDLVSGEKTTHRSQTSSIKLLIAPPHTELFKPNAMIEGDESIPRADMKVAKMV